MNKKYTAVIDIQDIVTLKTDLQKTPRICTGISIRKGCITYHLALGSEDSWHYDFEIEYIKKEIHIGFTRERNKGK